MSGGERYRIRQGSYRIVYAVEDERLIVYVVNVGHGREVYRGALQPLAPAVTGLRAVPLSSRNVARTAENRHDERAW